MPNDLRKQEIYAGTRGLILGIVKRRQWSISKVARQAGVNDDALREFLTAKFGEILAERDMLDRLVQFGRSRLRPWNPDAMRLLRMSRDFDTLYR